MVIGFDAKRYFHNPTGLGNYSRTLVNGLAQLYPGQRYLLYNPREAQQFTLPDGLPLEEKRPQGLLNKWLSSLWRSSRIVADLKADEVELYHGLSHELPAGIARSGIRSVVTVHDLIFERYPKQYGAYEVAMHRHKIKHACRQANRIIAISEQTKKDLCAFYGVAPEKITVCYQSCDPLFALPAPDVLKQDLAKAYNLPAQFILYVGSVIERKNLLGICRAMEQAGAALHLPLVVVGSTGGTYAQQVKAYLAGAGLSGRVLFLNDYKAIAPAADIRHTTNLAALYQMAHALVYPSFFEGFGIPVLEAMWSGLPVITSETSCMPETAGDAAYYIPPDSVAAMATALLHLQDDPVLCGQMAEKGRQHAQQFGLEPCTKAVMQVYEQVMEGEEGLGLRA